MDTELALESLVKLMKMLSDPTRLKILMYVLAVGPTTPLQVSQDLGKPLNLVSYHLGSLHRIGLLNRRRVGKRVLYAISDDEFKKLLSLLSDYVKKKDFLLRTHIEKRVKRRLGE